MENSREDANAETGILRDGDEIYGTPPSVLSFFSVSLHEKRNQKTTSNNNNMNIPLQAEEVVSKTSDMMKAVT